MGSFAAYCRTGLDRGDGRCRTPRRQRPRGVHEPTGRRRLSVFTGPLAGSEAGRICVLLIVDAPTKGEVHDRRTGDPWFRSEQAVISSVETRMAILGAERPGAVS